jgi:outer membrane protein assembly factor BamB
MLVLLCAAGVSVGSVGAETPAATGAAVADEAKTAALGVHGGLCVQVGAGDTDFVAELAATGRFLVQVLDANEQAVDEARRRLRAKGVYGIVSVDRLPEQGGLPYTENLVNLVVMRDSGSGVRDGEIMRVLCPGGVAVRIDPATGNLRPGTLLRKPWPAGMDQWSHPRHSASGNAVSQDVLVGPPRRVRWVVGAQAEVRGMVSGGGRNFYAGVLTRDAFNGLRLWHRDLLVPTAPDEFTMKNLRPEHAAPVTDGRHLYVVDQGRLLAVDAASGKTLREFPEAGRPTTVLFDNGTLFAVTGDAVRALDAQSTDVHWTYSASGPRHVVVGDDAVALVQGRGDRGEAMEAVVLNRATGGVRWKRADFPWLPKVRRTVYHRGVVAYEVSSLNDDGPGNALHLVSAADGRIQLDYPFLPGMNHLRQARAMFIEDRLWLLHGGKDASGQRHPIRISALDFRTGDVLATHKAGLAHCFPPVMTTRYMLSGEFDLTDLQTGQVDAHQITKAACGRDGGWVPANGLIYVTPKHCVCWPMLRGYAALAPQRPAGSVADMDLHEMDFPLEQGVDPPADVVEKSGQDDWPCYRHDPWRSGSTSNQVPVDLQTLWTVELGGHSLTGPIVEDWQEDLYVKGPITSPTIAGNRVVVARPDTHEVVALDAADGSIQWRFTANGRVDTAPTICGGLCLFGAKSGWVYCLRVDDGRMVWRLRAAPLEEQIIAYGQLESPWPVPGSVLVIDNVAYFAAGRQSLADGGILIFAVDPASGKVHWVQRLDSVPQRGFYECSGLEFDNFDLLHREGDGVGMSRWVFDRETGEMSLDRWAAFARLNTGGGEAVVPRGCWSYAPRHQRRIPSFTARRPLAVFRDKVLFGCLQGSATLYRRDFDLEGGEKFDTRWMTGWEASARSRNGEMPWRSHRLAEKARWQVDVFGETENAPGVDAMVLAGRQLIVAGSNGDLRIVSTEDGQPLVRRSLPAPLWDGMAVAGGRLYYSACDGQLLCLGSATP